MARYVALLRAINVGGTGKLRMTELRATCVDAGFTAVATYIASGNVVFQSRLGARAVQAELERRLQALLGKPVGVMLRTDAEMQAIVAQNPFPRAAANLVYTFFFADVLPRNAFENVTGRSDEVLRLGRREIYVHYPVGMGKSKLKIPLAKTGTARNMNTVAALAGMAAAL